MLLRTLLLSRTTIRQQVACLFGKAMENNPNSDSLRSQKQAARKHVKTVLRQLPQEVLQIESAAIADAVVRQSFYTNSVRLGIYISSAQLKEVDTDAVVELALKQGKRCYAPLVEDRSSNMQLLHLDDLSSLVSTPPWGIREPTRSYPGGSERENALQMEAPLDVLLMPGQAFTTLGARLGRGGGYYDKFVASARQQAQERGWEPPLLVGLAFSAQVLEELPMGESDQHVDVLVTPSQVHMCSERARKL